MNSSLKVGDKVIVKPLEWFRNNWIMEDNVFSFRPRLWKDFHFTIGMQRFCDRVVTIASVDSSSDNNLNYYSILEDNNSYYWIYELFVNSSTYLDPVNCIRTYCNDFCVLGDRSKCNNSECPLYYFGSYNGKGVIS